MTSQYRKFVELGAKERMEYCECHGQRLAYGRYRLWRKRQTQSEEIRFGHRWKTQLDNLTSTAFDESWKKVRITSQESQESSMEAMNTWAMADL